MDQTKSIELQKKRLESAEERARVVSNAPDSFDKSLVTLAVYPCAGRMQFDDV